MRNVNKLLSFFPTPYPDEDFRSIIFRYHRRTSNTVYNETKKELFNLNSYIMRHLPRNLRMLINRLPKCSLNEMYFLNQHTVYPLIMPFLTLGQRSQLTNDLITGIEGKTSMAGELSGSAKKGLISEYIRYCSKCLVEDHEQYGECYAHRSHQLKFVDVCYKHSLPLRTHCHLCGQLLAKPSGDIMLSELVCQCGVSLLNLNDEVVGSVMKDLAADSQCLINYNNNIDADELSQRFLACIGEKGYIHPSGIILKSKLLRDFLRYLEKEKLILLLPQPNLLFERRTIKRLFNPIHLNQHIIMYLLLMRFLSGTVDAFLNSLFSFSVELLFGSGPWPCGNPICTDYKSNKILRHQRRQYSGTVTATFSCDVCGFTYVRSKGYVDDTRVEKYSVIAIGKQAIETIEHLYEQEWSIRDIAKKIFVSDRTVSKCIIRSKHYKINTNDAVLEEVQKARSQIAATNEIDTKKGRYRTIIQKSIEDDKNISRMALKKKNTVQYNWLMKHDRHWMETKLPPVKVGGSQKLDLSKVDEELSKKIEEISKKLYFENPPKRIKSFTILSKLTTKDIGRYNHNRSSLPKVCAMLDNYIETEIDYLIRNLPFMIAFLRRKRYKQIMFESLQVRQGYRNCSPDDRKKIEDELKKVLSETN
jgi:predicted DNA-binding protein YlxM (UPF0122 family)